MFCSECGSGLPFLNEVETTLFIPAKACAQLDWVACRRSGARMQRSRNQGDAMTAKLMQHDFHIEPVNIYWADETPWYEERINAKKM